MPTLTAGPFVEYVANNSLTLQVVPLSDPFGNSALNVSTVRGPLYVIDRGASGANASGFRCCSRAGGLLLQVRFNGDIEMAGVLIPEADIEVSAPGVYFLSGGSPHNYQMWIDTDGNVHIPDTAIVTTMDSITLEKSAEGDFTDYQSVLSVQSYAPVVRVWNRGTDYPILQVVNSAGACVFKLKQTGDVETIGGLFTGVASVPQYVKGSIKF